VTFGPTDAGPGVGTILYMERTVEASTTVRAPFERAREVLVDDCGCVVAERVTPQERRDRCFHTVLGVEIGAGGGLHQEVVVDVGAARAIDASVVLPVRWHAAGRERLFPTFAGDLVVTGEDPGSRLVLRGTYAVPLGLLGRFGDGVAGRRLTHRSLSSFLEQAASRLDAEVDRRTASVAWHPAPYPVALREASSENYIG
jgi:hypothetical protein